MQLVDVELHQPIDRLVSLFLVYMYHYWKTSAYIIIGLCTIGIQLGNG